MPDLDERARAFRERMVDALPGQGITNERVLNAMRVVPRHRFIERFVAAPPDARAWSLDDMREHVVDEDVDDDTLALVHDVNRALPIPGFTGFDVQSSVSAPNIVATMLQLLDLHDGMRVLEIGAGSGYNAALLAHLVGDPSLVTTVDIDDALIEPARRRLARAGFADVEVVCGDGDDGVAARAPFDRIVATVGCNDLSPAWFRQLHVDGFVLAPTRHGTAHPLVRAAHDGTGDLVGPAGFLKMRGRQDEAIWWRARSAWWPDKVTWEPAPYQLDSDRAQWDAGLYVALRDARGGGFAPMLGDGQSAALFEREHGLGQCGDNGAAFADRLRALLDDWESVGRPTMTDYATRWEPRTSDPHVDSIAGPWCIPRVHHSETVTLRPPA